MARADATLVVEATGPLALLQDLGRPGRASLGVSPSGAADRDAFRLANRLVGNDEGAVAVECTLGGLRVTAQALVVVVVTGAPTQVRVNTRAAWSHSTLTLHPGDRLSIAAPATGLRSYLAVRGGLDCPPVLGSAASDVLSGLGPPPLQPGQQLRVGSRCGDLPDVDSVPPRALATTLAVLPGPRLDWFEPAAWAALLGQTWTVTPDCDRVAVRLSGPELGRQRADELPSEGLVRGALQVPASGRPLIFLADHPVTGGYPVIGVLTDRASDDAAQLRPGDEVRLAAVRRAGASR